MIYYILNNILVYLFYSFCKIIYLSYYIGIFDKKLFWILIKFVYDFIVITQIIYNIYRLIQ